MNCISNDSTHRLSRALACQKWEQCRGETRKQGFSARLFHRRVKAVVFREARRKYFWLDFLVLFHQRKKNRNSFNTLQLQLIQKIKFTS